VTRLFSYLKIGMQDVAAPQNDITIHFEDCFSFIGTCPVFPQCVVSDLYIHTIEKAKVENSAVYVHCAAGASRSASVVVAYHSMVGSDKGMISAMGAQ